MNFKMVMSACALSVLSACAATKDSGVKTDVTAGIADNEQRLLRVAGATRAGGDTEGAKKIYRQVIKQSKRSVLGHLELASILNAERNSTQALEVLAAAETLQPENVEVLRELANTLINLNRPGEALVKIDKAISLSANDSRLYNSKGIAHDMKDEREQAQAAYKKGIALAPESAGYIENNLAMSYIISRKLPEALSLLMKLADSPQATPTIRQNLALAYGLAGNQEKSLEWSLKDLAPKEAEENQKIFEKLALAAPAFVSPDTSVKPVTIIESPLPAKLPELTDAQKDALKNAMQFMKEGKKDSPTIATSPASDASEKREVKNVARDKPEPAASPEKTTAKKSEPAPAAGIEPTHAEKTAEPAAGAADNTKKPSTTAAPKPAAAKTTGNVFTKEVPDVPKWNWKK